ncbi:hypothetical protein EDB85DRAFT_1984028, partial [Lactarius pseudohatsudake]
MSNATYSPFASAFTAPNRRCTVGTPIAYREGTVCVDRPAGDEAETRLEKREQNDYAAQASNAPCAPVRLSAGMRWTQLQIAHCTSYSSTRPAPPTCSKRKRTGRQYRWHYIITLGAILELWLCMNIYVSVPPVMDAPATPNCSRRCSRNALDFGSRLHIG